MLKCPAGLALPKYVPYVTWEQNYVNTISCTTRDMGLAKFVQMMIDPRLTLTIKVIYMLLIQCQMSAALVEHFLSCTPLTGYRDLKGEWLNIHFRLFVPLQEMFDNHLYAFKLYHLELLQF